MATKSFISARIPKHLMERLEAHVEATGDSKTDVIVEALAEHLAHDEESKTRGGSIERRLSSLEHWIFERFRGIDNKLEILDQLAAKVELLETVELADSQQIPDSEDIRDPSLIAA